MNQTFQYSILRYRPSYLLDERINIGILFLFKNFDHSVLDNKNKVVFLFPTRLRRISQCFPNLGNKNLYILRNYLTSFKANANKINREKDFSVTDLSQIIESKFILDDANSFFFSEIKEGIYFSIKDTKAYYEDLYFKFYDQKKTIKPQDELVREAFQNTLKKLTQGNDIRLSYFKKNVSIENKITSSKFEYKWQNGTANLIKTLGFNLSGKQDIQDKAFKWSSAINYINQIPKYQNLHFDILVAPPTDNNLFKSYDKALEVLNDIKANKTIISQEGLTQYAQKALDTIKPIETL